MQKGGGKPKIKVFTDGPDWCLVLPKPAGPSFACLKDALPCILTLTGPDSTPGPFSMNFPHSERAQLNAHPKFRILCTEDDADTRDLVIVLLSTHNCEVITSTSSSESLHLARTQHFDLYLLDNWLPGLSGIELCRELRKFDSQTPILFYSGAAYDKDKRQALECGAQGYLTKPADGEELVEEVLRLIAASRLPDNNFVSTLNLPEN